MPTRRTHTARERWRHRLFALGLGCATLLGAACGDAPQDATGPYREPVDPVKDAKVAQRTLEPRDTPLEIGSTAPPLPGARTAGKRVVVFYRGHW